MAPSKTASPRSARKRPGGNHRGPGKQLFGSETPRLFTRSRRPLTRKTTAGYEAIDFAENVLGLTLFPWQRWLLLHMLELNPDGTFRFRTVVILVARQNGKTTLMQVVALWRMYVDGVGLVIGTAQNLDVAEEAWMATVELAQTTPELAREIEHVDRTNGKKALRLQTGERYKVAASSRRGGRGLSGDTVLLDELREHKTWEAWSAVSKTTLAKKSAQIIGMSNAGDGQSIVLAHLRDRALAKIAAHDDDTSIGLFEWSAPEDAEITDRAGWTMANPALGYSITEPAIENAIETDSEDVFRTEVLCQWVETVLTPTIPPDDWAGCLESTSRPIAVTLAADINPTRSRASIAAAGRSDVDEQRWHTQLIETGPGTDWLLAALIDRALEQDATVYLDPANAAGALIPALVKAEVRVETVSGREYAQACGILHDQVTSKGLAHIGQDELDAAVEIARTKRYGESFKWTHYGTDGDITPLVSVTVALWGAMAEQDNQYDVGSSIY